MGASDPRSGRLGWQLIVAGRRLGKNGLIAAAEGNLSCITDDGSLMISRAGVRKDALEPSDLLVLSREGAVIHGSGRPSTELALHRAVYETCIEARAVIHAHPIAATAFAAAERVPEWSALAESIVSLGEVRLVPFAHPGTDDLARSLRSAIGSSRVLLLAHHGALTIGESLEQALQRMELLERLCSVHIAGQAMGGIRPLAAQEQALLRHD